MEQGSAEWHAARCGKVTASRIADLIAKTKTGRSASRDTYMCELVAERLTGVPAERFVNDAMRWGTEHEGKAREAFSFEEAVIVTQVGFVEHPDIPMSGASPDGLIGTDDLLEIKCPNTSTHLGYVEDGIVPKRYIPQITWQAACTGAQYAHFVSYDPRLPVGLDYFRAPRMEIDQAYVKEIESEVRFFLGELDERVNHLLRRARRAA